MNSTEDMYVSERFGAQNVNSLLAEQRLFHVFSFQDQEQIIYNHSNHKIWLLSAEVFKTGKREHKREAYTSSYLHSRGPKSLSTTALTPLLANSRGRRCASLCVEEAVRSGWSSMSPFPGGRLAAA